MGESVIRGRKAGFTVLYNSALQDRRLSLKTIGLFAVMSSFPGDWNYSVKGLAARCGVGRDAIRGCLKELEDAGYLLREQSHDAQGRFGGAVFVLREQAAGKYAPLPENQSTAEMAADDAPLPDLPSPEKPTPEKPTPENQPQVNKQVSKYSRKKYPPISPQGEALFEQFWAVYPKKRGKEDARKAWAKLDPDIDLCRRMAAALAREVRSSEWTREGGRFVPYPATWLNGRRWEDEPTGHAAGAPAGRGEEVTYF